MNVYEIRDLCFKCIMSFFSWGLSKHFRLSFFMCFFLRINQMNCHSLQPHDEITLFFVRSEFVIIHDILEFFFWKYFTQLLTCFQLYRISKSFKYLVPFLCVWF